MRLSHPCDVYLNVAVSPSSRPTQLVSVTVRWTCRREEERCCTMTSLLWPTSPASTAAPASPAKASDISTALMWLCVARRWEIPMTLDFVKFSLTRNFTCRVSLTGQSAGYLRGQCDRERERGQRLRLSVHCVSLWHQEPERGVLAAFSYWWHTHGYGPNAAAKYCYKWEFDVCTIFFNTRFSHLWKSVLKMSWYELSIVTDAL